MRIGLAFLISLAVTIVMGFVFIPVLRRLKAGQSIKRAGPAWHLSKEGTPTMGGILFITGILCAVLLAGIPELKAGDHSALSMLVFSLIQGAIGFFDDYMKVRRHKNEGLKGTQKTLTLRIPGSTQWVTTKRNSGARLMTSSVNSLSFA